MLELVGEGVDETGKPIGLEAKLASTSHAMAHEAGNFVHDAGKATIAVGHEAKQRVAEEMQAGADFMMEEMDKFDGNMRRIDLEEFDSQEELDGRFNTGFWCVRCKGKKKNRKWNRLFFPFFLDLIEDHSRARYFSIALMVLVCLFSVHMTVFLLNFANVNNGSLVNQIAAENTTEPFQSIGQAIQQELLLYTQYIGIAIALTAASAPVFLYQSMWQNRYVFPTSFLFIIALLMTFVVLIFFSLRFQRDRHPPAPNETHTSRYPEYVPEVIISPFFIYSLELVIVAIGFLMSLVLGYVYTCGTKDMRSDWHSSVKEKHYKQHVRYLLRPLELVYSKFPEEIKFKYTLNRMLMRIPYIGKLLQINIPKIEPHLLHQYNDNFYYPTRFLYAFAFSMVFGAVLLVAAVANWQIVKAFLFNVCDLIAANTVLRNFVNDLRADIAFLQQNNLSSIYDALDAAMNKSSVATSVNDTIAFLDHAYAECNAMSTSAAVGIAVASGILCYLILLWSWLCLFRNYKNHIIKFRQGMYNRKKIHARYYRVFNATQYFGLQVMLCAILFLLGYLLGTLAGIIALFAIYIKSFRDWLIQIALPSCIAYVLISLPLNVVYLTTMTKDGGKTIKSRTAWVIFDYFNFILQLVRGFFNFFMKWFYWLIFFFIYLPRLDEPVIPSAWRFLDTSHCSFWSMLLMDHQFNNPVILIFRNYLMREIKFQIESLTDVSVLEKRRVQYQLNLTSFLLQNPSLVSSGSYVIEKDKERKLRFLSRVEMEDENIDLPTLLDRCPNPWACGPDFLTACQLNEFKEAFFLLDKKETGYVTAEVVKSMFCQIGFDEELVAEGSIEAVFQLLSNRSKLDLPEFISFIAFHLMTPTDLAIQFQVLSGIRRRKDSAAKQASVNGEYEVTLDNLNASDRSMCIDRKYLNKTRERYNLDDLSPYMRFIPMKNQDYITQEEFLQFQSIGKSRKFKKYRDEDFETQLEEQMRQSMQTI